MSQTTQRRGRGLVIAGAILTALSLVVSIAAAVDWVSSSWDAETRGIAYFGILL